MIKLYDYELSGNCYKLRLFLNILNVEYERIPVDFYPGREHKSDWFLQINPLGQLPALDHDGLVLRDAQAILIYLATALAIACVIAIVAAGAGVAGAAGRLWLNNCELAADRLLISLPNVLCQTHCSA